MTPSQKNPARTEKKEGSGKLLQFEKRILDTSSIGVLITRINDGAILYANQAIAGLLGLPNTDEIIGKPVPNFYWDVNEREAVLGHFRTEGSVRNYDLRARRADGSMIWVSISIQPFDYEGEQVLLSEITDITSRKQAERELLLRDRALASSLNGVVILNIQDNKPIYVNDAALKMTGYTREEILQLGLPDITGNPAEPQKIRAAIQTQGLFIGEELIKRKDGSVFPANFFSSLITDEKGQPFAIQSSFFDITEGKKAEEALRESEERFRRFTEATIEGLVFHEQGVVVDANPAALAIFGLSRNDEFIGKNLLEFIVPESHQTVLQQMQFETVYPYEIQCIRTDGSIFPVETSTRIYKVGEHTIRASAVRDISVRKRAEEALRAEKDFNAALVEASPAFLVTISGDGKLRSMNQSMLQALGYTLDEVEGKDYLSTVVSEDERSMLAGVFARLTDLREPTLNENHVVAKDGRQILVEWHGRPVLKPNGEFDYFFGLGLDITERKQAESLLAASEKTYRGILNSLSEAIYVQDPQGRFLDVNDGVVRMYGHPREYYIGKTPEIVSAPGKNDMNMANSAFERTLAGEPQKFEFWGIRKNGEIFPKEVRQYPGEFFGQKVVIVAAEDITERKRAETALQQEKIFSDAVINGLPGVFFLFDPQGKMVRWNEEYKRVLGYTTEETATRNALDPIADEDKEFTAAAIGRAFTEGQSSVEAHFVTRSGDHIPYQFIGRRLQLGDQLYLAGTGLDITERKRAEAQVERNLRETKVRYEVSQALAGAQTEDDVLDVLEQQSGLYPETMVLFYTFDRQGDDINAVLRRRNMFESGIVTSLPVGARFPIAQFTLLSLASPDKPFISNNFVEDERVDPASREAARQLGAISQAIFLLMDGNMQMGVINVVAKSAGYFDEHKQHLYQTLSELGAAALQTARLRDQIQDAMTRRGYQVQVSTEIAQEVAAASGLSDLFERVVTLTKERFGYYHTQLLRYDVIQDAVVLIHGYGETGQKMLEDGHKLPMGSGLIGAAAATGETMLRPTLADDLTWQPNPLLPDTKGEIAVPIKFGEQVLGVLDVQSDQAGALTEDDRLLLEGLCGQVAVAMEQTRLRTEMAERLEEVNRLYRSMSREGWKSYRETAELPNGFVFDQAGVRPVEEVTLDTETFTSIPMKVLGGEVVGNLAVADDPQRPMSPEDLTFLQQVSEQIALALEGARLAAQTQSALAQTEKLSDASLRFAQAADLQELVKVAAETLSIPNINRAFLESFAYDSSGQLKSMTVIANWWNGHGPEPTPVGTVYSADALKLLSLFANKEPVFLNNTFEDPRVDGADMEIVRERNIRALASLPLFQGNQQVGALLLESEELHEFTEDETRLFTAMGPQIATVLENRRQFERAQQQAEREGMLNIISQKIQSATTVEAVLQIAARELGHALGAPMTIAQLSMKEKK